MSDYKFKPAPKLKIELDKNGEITEDSWSKMMNYYEDYNEYERRAAHFPKTMKDFDKRVEELRAEADKEREVRMKKREIVEKLLEQKECRSCNLLAKNIRGKKVVSKKHKGWICQKCAQRVCNKCGAPLERVPGLDFIDEEKMLILHSPILGVSTKCIDGCGDSQS